MLNLNEFYVLGVDVSKDFLTVYDGEKHYVVRRKNGLKELDKLIRRKVGKQYGKVIVSYEPTGGYSYHLYRYCSEKGIKTLRVNPYRASHFFKSQRERGKNDAKDAEDLRKFVFVFPDEVKETKVDERVERLKKLVSLYEKIQKDITNWKNRLSQIKEYDLSDEAIKSIKRIIKELERSKRKVLKEINMLIDEDEELRRRREYIKSMYGVGDVISMALLIFFLRYPDASRSQIVSLAGLDVVHVSSGKSVKRKSKISKRGNKFIRNLLFMAKTKFQEKKGDLKVCMKDF